MGNYISQVLFRSGVIYYDETTTNVNDATGQKPKKLLDRVREILRLKHYSIRTEEASIGWMIRCILYHNKRHPEDMGAAEIEAFLSHLAVEGNVSVSTQDQAFNTILFLYWSGSGSFTNKTSRQAMAACTCHMHWSGSIAMRRENGAGSMFFPRIAWRKTLDQA